MSELLEIYQILRDQKDLKPLNGLAKALGYKFKDLTHLAEALTHSSAAREFNVQNPQLPSLDWNEHLEFLGDSVLGLTITQLLMVERPKYREGQLSKIRASLISQTPLA